MKTNEQALHDLLLERYDLWQKIDRSNATFSKLPGPQRHLLGMQLDHMHGYLRVLDLRIEDLNKKVSNDMSDL
ncbi:crAss001_48 related protein [Loigolactobacillus zhaoyuanensis]|uniref:Uncharacterized protein n=1 Tax=Loigolactobacillus zhaoyuanensis TaxID=2486017 RepID=A0ABW8U8K8_9LACO